MQTFVPLSNVPDCARSLDRSRLGKQRVEVKQILEVLCYDGLGWKNHPVINMWRNHELALVHYGIEMCLEWRTRGYRDTLLDYFIRQVEVLNTRDVLQRMPPWWGDDAVHRSHRSNLVRKNPDHYRQLWPDEVDDLPYVWPTTKLTALTDPDNVRMEIING